MEGTLRIVLMIAVVGVSMWAAKYLHEHRVDLDIERMAGEVQRLEDANEDLRVQNRRYRNLVRGLREDPRVLERRARETLQMARPDEIVILFDDDAGAY